MKFMKILLVSFLLLVYTSTWAQADTPGTSARSAILMESENGRVLWEKNINEKLPMASTTKIMTALVAIENGNINEVVTVGRDTTGIEGSSIWLAPDEKHTLENLLYGLMLRSGNDAAMTIADHVGGSVENFINIMNKKAKALGANDTHFMNPHGLHHDEHYTTAYDLALITSHAMKNETFKKIVSTKHKTIPWEGHQWDRAMQNKNKILWQYEGANGVKTGYTTKAGRCLVASASREGMQLVAVVLNCHPMFEDCMRILDYGFSKYKKFNLYQKGEMLAMIPIEKGKEEEVALVTDEECSIVLRESERQDLKIIIDKPDFLKAPVEKDHVFGAAKIYLGDELIKQIPLVSSNSVEKRTIFNSLEDIIKRWIQ